MHDEMDKKLVFMKAKEYDKVDWMRKVAEVEAKMKHLEVDNENLVKERNQLDIANVEINRQKQEIEQKATNLE